MIKNILLKDPITDITEHLKGYSTIKLIECQLSYPKLFINKEPFIQDQIFNISNNTIISRNENIKSPTIIVMEIS
jgi:hypothetical protein